MTVLLVWASIRVDYSEYSFRAIFIAIESTEARATISGCKIPFHSSITKYSLTVQDTVRTIQ